MIKQFLGLTVGACFAVGVCYAASGSQEAKAVLQKAQMTIGSLNSVQFSGTGVNGLFGQAMLAGKEWPRRELESVTGSINYEQRSAKLEFVFKEEVFQGRRQNTQVNGDRAWTVRANGVNPQLASANERQLQIWMTPHGFVRAGLAATDAAVTSRTAGGKKVDVVSFTVMNKYKLEGIIEASGLITKVETRFPNSVLGDMPYSFTYSDYKDFGGSKFPAHVLQSEDGFAVNDLTISSVQPNAPVDIPVPPQVQSASIPPVKVVTTKLGDGIWFVGGGSHHSVIVEFDKFLAIIEAPQNEARSLAVIAEAKRLVPNKPIRYLVNTHHHFDHAGGLRTYVAEGATIVTHVSNRAYWEKNFVAPATLTPDAQTTARRKPSIQTVVNDGKYVITDGKQSIEVYGTTGDSHTDEILIAYLPSVKALVEADSFAAGDPTNVVEDEVALNKNIQRHKLDIVTIVGIHGSGPVPFEEFTKDMARAR